jgi:hypothetical protein
MKFGKMVIFDLTQTIVGLKKCNAVRIKALKA